MTDKNGKRTDLSATVAPILAPGAGGFSAKLDLDDKQVLHAAICIDGKCYSTDVDLAPAIAAVLAKIASYHADLHAAMPAAAVSGDLVLGAVDRAVDAAGRQVVTELIGRHVSVACSGWLDDIGNALKGAGSSVYHSVAETVQKLKEPITAAAAAAATGIGGPLAGAAASQLVGPIIDTAANLGQPTPEKKAIDQAAKTDPAVAQALATAKEAAAHTIAAYHVQETATQAAAGHPGAQAQIAQVVRDAEAGDPRAHAVVPLVASGFSAKHGRHRHHHRGPDVYRKHAIQAAQQAVQQAQQAGRPPLAVGYVNTGRRQHQTYFFNVLPEAMNWIASLSPNAFRYAAVFDARNPTVPVNERLGSV